MPSSRSVGSTSASTSRDHSEYSRLHGGDRVDGVRAADRLRGRLAQPDVADLALGDELGQRADGLLDRRARVDAVLVVEVDVVGAQALAASASIERRTFSGEPSMTRRSGWSVGRRPADPELRRDRHLVAAPGERPAEQLLVRVRAVDLGGVEERAAELERAVDRRDRLRLVGGAVEGAHAHAAEADGADGEVAEGAVAHARHATPRSARTAAAGCRPRRAPCRRGAGRAGARPRTAASRRRGSPG